MYSSKSGGLSSNSNILPARGPVVSWNLPYFEEKTPRPGKSCPKVQLIAI